LVDATVYKQGSWCGSHYLNDENFVDKLNLKQIIIIKICLKIYKK